MRFQVRTEGHADGFGGVLSGFSMTAGFLGLHSGFLFHNQIGILHYAVFIVCKQGREGVLAPRMVKVLSIIMPRCVHKEQRNIVPNL